MWSASTRRITIARRQILFEAEGNLAYEVGAYALKTKDGKVADRGKYCVVWKRVNGQWLLHRDIWTTNLPEAKK